MIEGCDEKDFAILEKNVLWRDEAQLVRIHFRWDQKKFVNLHLPIEKHNQTHNDPQNHDERPNPVFPLLSEILGLLLSDQSRFLLFATEVWAFAVVGLAQTRLEKSQHGTRKLA